MSDNNGVPRFGMDTGHGTMEAECSVFPTEMGLRIQVTAHGAVASIEFDPDEIKPSGLAAVVAAFPEIVNEAVARLIDHGDGDDQ